MLMFAGGLVQMGNGRFR